MKQSLLVCALASPALLAFAVPGDDVSFKPAAGSTVTKVFTNYSTMTLDDMSMAMNGEEMDPEMMGMDMTIEGSTTTVVTDEYVRLGEGRPAVLKRTFDELSLETNIAMENAMMGAMDMDLDGSSELADTTVVFTWNEDDGEFGLAFDEDEDADEELLEGLTEDMDLRCLLPEGEVDVDASWRVDVERLVDVLAPGGNLKILPDMDDVDAPMMGGPNPGMNNLSDLWGEVDGTAMATYLGTREADGVTVAVISIKVEISGANDLTEQLQEDADNAEAPEGMDMEMIYDSADAEFEIEGEGELLWNVAGGHLHSFEFEGDMTLAMDMAMAMSMMGQDMDMEMSMEMSGEIKLGAETRDQE